jgi:hypothetical protein
MAVMLGQHFRSSRIRLDRHATVPTGPHSAPSYSIFRPFIQRRVEAAPRVFGVSDCHTDYIENFKWAESLDTHAFRYAC